MMPASGFSTRPRGKKRFCGAVLAGTNWRSSIFLMHWAMLKPTTIHGVQGGTKQYALKFISDPGKQNGLYWESPRRSTQKPTRTAVGVCNRRRV